MNYKKRHVEHVLLRLSKAAKVVMVTGARQVGKTTLLRHLFPDIKMITFDPVQDLHGARQDPDLFLDNFSPPLILDEIQFAPELLPALKRRVDQSEQMGQYFLTGSQNLSMLKTVAESMAGRVQFIDLGPMTLHEENETFSFAHGVPSPPSWLSILLESHEQVQKRFAGCVPISLYEAVWRGGMPGLLSKQNDMFGRYFQGYVRTYIERDVRLSLRLNDLSDFQNFMAIMSALTAQEINHNQLGRELDMNARSTKQWLSLLRHSYQWREIPSYHRNAIKIVAKKQKGYIADSGLACFMQHIPSPEALAGHPLRGALVETFCMNTIFALAEILPFRPGIYHWRSKGGAEVDCVLAVANKLYPIEIKSKTIVGPYDARGIEAFRKAYGDAVQPGIVLYAGSECYQVNKNGVLALPFNALMRP